MRWIHEAAWGDVPTALAAVFTAFAAVAAWKTLGSQRKQIREQQAFIAEQSVNLALERQELRAVAQERREAQARRIVYEVTPPYVKVLNQSGDPITDVRCVEGGQQAVRAVASEAGGVAAALIAEQMLEREQAHIDVLGAGRLGWFQRRSGPSGGVEVFFTDRDGVRWRLDSNRTLQEEAPPPPVA
ncbi:hypothetical protein [Streptomyces sp. NPDC005760]|uniref:hypothetical protein n=1 Tax=Streptomyces sp. NPDC005760 TaxID=3156718 RepID=UPI0033CF84C9